MIKEGSKLIHKLNHRVYQVKMIKGDTVVLESAHTPYRLWFGEEGLKVFFDRIGSFRVCPSEGMPSQSVGLTVPNSFPDRYTPSMGQGGWVWVEKSRTRPLDFMLTPINNFHNFEI